MKMKNQILAITALVVAALLVGSACMSTASYHTAQPIAEGETDIGVAVEMIKFTDEDMGFIVPHPRIYIRRGIDEQSDFGVTAGHFGIAGDFNFMFHSDDSGAASINPYVGLSTNQSFGAGGDDDDFFGPNFQTGISDEGDYLFLTVTPAFLYDLMVGDEMVLVLGGKPGIIHGRSGGFSSSQLMIGASVGMKFPMGSGHILPEFNILKVEDTDGLIMTFGAAFGF